MFRRDRSGSLITVFAVILPVLGLTAAGAFELGEVFHAKTQLQSFVDAAAMSGARELMADRSAATTERARLMADSVADPLKRRWTITTEAQSDSKLGTMIVSQEAVRPSLFGSLLRPDGFRIKATATGTANSLVPLCVLGLKDAGQNVALGGSASLTANGCLVQSNGNLIAGGAASVQAGANRAAGAASGNITPTAVTDAPPVADPFKALAINVPTLCTDTLIEILPFNEPIKPGVHCGGLQLLGSTTLNLLPGEHYFVGGPLTLLGNATITGSDVVLIFRDAAAVSFGGSSTLSLEGRKSGPYAGFVLMTDRSFVGTLSLSTKNAKKLLGTVYLPNATLDVSGNGNKVADQSAWTVVVAKELAVGGSANLTINANYQAATVPVPIGVGPLGVRLAK